MWYPPTNVVQISDETHRLFGLDPDEVNLDMQGFLDVIHPDDRSLVIKTIEKVASGGPKDPYEYRIITPKGEIRYMLNRGEIKRDENGVAIKVSGSTQDVTEERLAEQKILESLKEKELMLAEIHHRVKNNLAVISGLLELEVYRSENEELIKVLQMTIAKIKSMALLHENLYQEEKFINIPIGELLPELIEIALPENNTPDNPDFNIETKADIKLNINQAIPFSLIINHLIAMTHSDVSVRAFENKAKVKLHGSDSEVRLSFSKLHESFLEMVKPGQNNTDQFSALLLNTLLSQLDADLRVEEADKEMVIEFKREEEKGSSVSQTF